MKVAIVNYCGTVGKTTIAAHMLSPRMKGAPVYAVETINETTQGFGVDTQKLKGEKYGDLYKSLLIDDDAIIDVGASNVEEFLDRMIRYEDSHEEVDYFIVPVTSGAKEQKETLKTIEALVGLGVPGDKIRVLFNRVDTDVAEEFPAIIGYARRENNCAADRKACLYENEVYDLLGAKKLTMAAVLDDDTDYKARLKTLDRVKQRSDVAHCADMIALKALSKRASRELDFVYAALFA